MSSVPQRAVLAMALLLAMASAATAQTGPYIGYIYPAGGQQGATVRIKLGGQNLDGARAIVVSGKGVSGKVLQVLRKLGPQDMTLLREQMDILSKKVSKKDWDALAQVTDASDPNADSDIGMVSQETLSRLASLGLAPTGPSIKVETLAIDPQIVDIVTKIRTRLAEYVQRPASAAIASIVAAEITFAADAPPGKREVRIVCDRGVSNPLVFHVGLVPEASRPPMLTGEVQVLGKEALALRRQRHNDTERKITVPCTVNGQIGSAEVHRYRFTAQKGQRLVISTSARELVPFIADAVPGWFQPVLAIYDDQGKELAYNDDFSFDPDPLITFEAPKYGEYVLTINDAIFRGREDFVYRVTIDETPLVTSIFPLGAKFGTSPAIAMKGWNLEGATLGPPKEDSETGAHILRATKGRKESNRVLFAPDTLRETYDKESNNDLEHAQKVDFPIIVNGRVDRPDDSDVFQITGRAGDTIVAEVKARRLNSPLDSVLKVTDARGAPLAMNDDHDDPEAGTTTHYADSYLTVKLPADGAYFVHLGDITRNGGEEYAYRLRISRPRPDFALRVAPSSVFLRGNSAPLSVYVYRKDGFADPIRVYLKNPPAGISGGELMLSGTEPVAKMAIHADSNAKPGLYSLVVEGSATIGAEEVAWEAAPAEDRMQAFLWRHLVPAKELKAFVFDPAMAEDDPTPRRKRDTTASANKPAAGADGKPKFTPEQVAGQLRRLERLFDEGLLTEAFYRGKVAECGGTQ